MEFNLFLEYQMIINEDQTKVLKQMIDHENENQVHAQTTNAMIFYQLMIKQALNYQECVTNIKK
ncbi:unnamed protein product [Paramecium pentaurelia]|uniref:Uncharacterized protein n=1 Tax=Paramecium pentaurelia TaxID=43138 RepID=A0A8S1XTD0_9CILI|nr:unnamed protein product [Paramecium pentaurelia]